MSRFVNEEAGSTMINKRMPRILLCFIFICYLYVLLKVILFKFGDIDLPFLFRQFSESLERPERMLNHLQYQGNLIPFHEIAKYFSELSSDDNAWSTVNFIGNILAFIPLGFMLPLVFRNARMTIGRITLFCFGASLFLELTQLWLYIGTFDVDDLLLNTLGGAIGGTLIRFMSPKSFVPGVMQPADNSAKASSS